ncbi:MAG: hypothetical protein GY822_22010 [Deltaproteobacteria bacterium]|nr:hypothetical protein [Deltaproteobacteria bacterium]
MESTGFSLRMDFVDTEGSSVENRSRFTKNRTPILGIDMNIAKNKCPQIAKIWAVTS